MNLVAIIFRIIHVSVLCFIFFYGFRTYALVYLQKQRKKEQDAWDALFQERDDALVVYQQEQQHQKQQGEWCRQARIKIDQWQLTYQKECEKQRVIRELIHKKYEAEQEICRQQRERQLMIAVMMPPIIERAQHELIEYYKDPVHQQKFLQDAFAQLGRQQSCSDKGVSL